MQPNDLRTAYEQDGFVVLRSFLPAEQFAELTENLDRYIHQVVPTLSDGDAFYDDPARPATLKQMARIEQDAYFAEYLHHPLWTATARTLLGEEIQMQGAEWFNKPPATNHVTPPHQDNFYFCLEPPQVLTMWLALDEIDEENGCLRYYRGSHRLGIRPHARTTTLGFSQGIPAEDASLRESEEVAIRAQPNDLLIHHGNTIHRADANRSTTRHRRSFALVCRGVSARRNDAAYSRYLASSKAQRETFGLKN